MGKKCETVGHEWVGTAAYGWYRCQRVIGSKAINRGTAFQSLVCGAVAYCPGCLGHCLSGRQVLLCADHVGLDITMLPGAAPHAQSSFVAPSGKQQSLF